MIVKLLNYTPNPDRTCAAAAFTSWKKLSPKEIFENLTDEEAFKFLRKVISYGHLSVTEHAYFTFSIEGISRACSHELVRHRLASYTQQSQRYVKFNAGELKYVKPKTIEGSEFNREYDELMLKIAEFYERMLAKIPAEDARYILPNAVSTNIVVTMNARELNHFFNLRLCNRAQWEIREVARRMLEEVRKVAPILFENAGPSCDRLGYCPEGELSCGRRPVKSKALRNL